MARLPRLYAPGCAQHIIQHGNNRDACFFSDQELDTSLRLSIASVIYLQFTATLN
jgi:REP element-mobilizing transposase RayT